MPDVETAYRFRKEFYGFMGVELPRMPPTKVLFWLQPPGSGHSIDNVEELFAVAETYNLPYT